MRIRPKGIRPNVRKFFVPDQGYMICDSDLDRADLQVVVWESGDAELKDILRQGIDMHIFNGLMLAGKNLPPLEELIEEHTLYKEHKERYGKERQFAKAWIHGTNYGGSAKTMAAAANISVAQSDYFQRRWFTMRPGIKQWHERVEKELITHRRATNKFGFSRQFFGRIEAALPEALAWGPQSTVAIYINKVWDAVVTYDPSIEILLQVHDSLVWQAPLTTFQTHKENFRKAASGIIVPYDDPLIIPVGFNFSATSWGDCK